jgi:hypothetical protein
VRRDIGIAGFDENACRVVLPAENTLVAEVVKYLLLDLLFEQSAARLILLKSVMAEHTVEHTTRVVKLDGSGNAHKAFREMERQGWEFKTFVPEKELQERKEYRCVFARPKQ